MHDQVRAIYRALTGGDLPELRAQEGAQPAAAHLEIIAQRFAELESIARRIPQVAERVPPFAFSPPLDVIEGDKELLIELAVPGVAKEDVHVDLNNDVLIVAGTRAGEKAANGRVFRHAEIPRGPFRRVLLLPQQVSGPPRVDVENGIIRIHLAKLPMGSVAQA
jgi:HSP20 family protein